MSSDLDDLDSARIVGNVVLSWQGSDVAVQAMLRLQCHNATVESVTTDAMPGIHPLWQPSACTLEEGVQGLSSLLYRVWNQGPLHGKMLN
eukprot:CAMPEP_0172748238 /NCGR_PEP_ID=MMETSP1074-20121228/144627_1 /TAXON_ID=2916 /ORGANISM="Ceratium fusus, Strain PA161109" /LENGTH=89 /DNA_ID=CAMNT_0013579947 /DNA_START=541 /DNA_END=810 /DNA_ORIENTATION=-